MLPSAALAVLVGLLAACGGTETVTVTETVGEKAGAGAPSDLVQFGYVRKLSPGTGAYRLRFDPAWMLTGETAGTAAVEDGVLEAGEPVPNDNYRVDDGHRLLTFVVPRDARVTVLRDGVAGSAITVAELAQLVQGESPFGKPLFEPLSTGFWMRTHGDRVRALDQQYLP